MNCTVCELYLNTAVGEKSKLQYFNFDGSQQDDYIKCQTHMKPLINSGCYSLMQQCAFVFLTMMSILKRTFHPQQYGALRNAGGILPTYILKDCLAHKRQGQAPGHLIESVVCQQSILFQGFSVKTVIQHTVKNTSSTISKGLAFQKSFSIVKYSEYLHYNTQWYWCRFWQKSHTN